VLFLAAGFDAQEIFVEIQFGGRLIVGAVGVLVGQGHNNSGLQGDSSAQEKDYKQDPGSFHELAPFIWGLKRKNPRLQALLWLGDAFVLYTLQSA
jgi:hypothetical protein